MPEFFQALLTDPLKILTLVGGSGGVMYWYDRYRDRPRLSIHSINETGGTREWRATFEVELLGRRETSLLPVVELTALDVGGDKVSARLHWQTDGESRRLEPHTIRSVTAVLDESQTTSSAADLTFSSFRRYTVRLTRGRKAVIRIVNFDTPPLPNALLFQFQMWRSARRSKRLFRDIARETAKLAPDDNLGEDDGEEP